MPPWRPSVGETLNFAPGPNHEAWEERLKASFEQTPRYLFRVYDDTSSGTTNAEYVSSRLADLGSLDCRRNMLDQTTKKAASILNQHLNWRGWQHERDVDNLVSWSSSLLFTLQYALYRHNKRRKGRSAHNVHIIMIDTTKFPRETFIRDLEVMHCLRNGNLQLKQLYRLRTTGQRGRIFSFGEYLSQGCINVSRASGVTSLKKLIDTGLFNESVCPYLGDSVHWSRLAKRVLTLREEVDSLRVEQQAWASLEHTRAFIAIAEACFGSHGANRNLAPAFAVMLLSLSRFSGFENDSVVAFLKLYPGT
ncbi:hypothetical protein GCG54_00003089 [Colletotrichum gloeosporioides]|uniref:DUF7587 domain-containing protein n=1 Tax=Colletotrichum gloeosporioides TaxID=474922 RepID=A0A8H4CVM0_COLGL|nr:uncharacterized protein GCG54_00003089 [Colletotrichum gloeosporioides]KAF3810911.1 hypothetical protein GCG54_00003089 [Colletotrichum gloeosporioides]